LKVLSREERTFILHEAPHKLKGTLDDLCEALGENRRISLCRELTKLNEEIQRCTLGEAVAYYSEHEPRGEYVLVIDGGEVAPEEQVFMSPLEAVAYYEKSGMTKNDAIKSAAKLLGMPRNEVYKLTIS
jgi:16S rRNA (cytidine1402-2'-O)-methyltransferase